MKRFFKIAAALLAVVIVLAGVALALFWNELRSLSTLEKLDDYGMFRMIYYGDYGFDEFLQVGAEKDSDIEAFVTKRLLKGIPIDLGVTGDGCTAFVTRNEKGEVIYGRNFDFAYSPSLQVFTKPDHGYASVSTANLSFAGYEKGYLPDGMRLQSFFTLAAPYLPFDGMNEKGLVIALLAVPQAHLDFDEEKVTLNTTTAIRLVLDRAATVEEAVELLKNYNIYFSGDITCHYLIADASGKSVIVEFWDGALQTVTTEEPYQVASNFIAYQGLNIGEGYDEFERYDAVKEAIQENNGVLSTEQAIDLLKEVGIRDGVEDKLQWSVVYNLSTLEGTIFAHRNTDNRVDFAIY